MEAASRGRGHEFNLAWRKTEEAALRRYQATHWLECLVGPLGISSQPTEKEFVSCLRNGLVLCNLINKVQPGSVPKVVESHTPSQSIMWDSQPLPAYQYFENIRNFLVAVEDLKLPVFEASVFERVNIEAGSATKVVDCILELKAYHEWKQMTGGIGCYKPARSPLLTPSRGRTQAQTHVTINADTRRRLELSASCPKQPSAENEILTLEDRIVKALAERMVDMKENMDNKFFASFRNGDMNQVELFSRILSSCFKEQLQNKIPKMELKSDPSEPLKEMSYSEENSTGMPLQNISNLRSRKCCRACIKKGKCNHWTLVMIQEKELSNLKVLLASTKREFEDLQSQLQSDLKQLGVQVQEMSAPALGYDKVMKENRTLYNMVQDLKGVHAHVSPEGDSFGETASTLKFAQSVSTVELGADKESTEVLELKTEIENLKKALANKETTMTPFKKPKAIVERPTPRARRLSIENCTTMRQQPPRSPTFSFKSKQAPRSPTSSSISQQPPRSPTFGFKSKQAPRSPTSSSTGQQPPRSPTFGFKSKQAPGSPTSSSISQQPPRSPTSGFKSQQAPKSPTSAFKSCNAPRSPTSAAIKSRGLKTIDNRTKIPSLQLPKTPESLITSIDDIKGGIQSERTTSSEFHTPTLINSTHGKGSHIRRSLRTIGKLINGSDRKNQQKRAEAAPLSPFNCQNEVKSPMAFNARTIRRQSLTGIPPPTMSRRSSLGGGSLPDSFADENRNSKTPALHASAKLTKRWL